MKGLAETGSGRNWHRMQGVGFSSLELLATSINGGLWTGERIKGKVTQGSGLREKCGCLGSQKGWGKGGNGWVDIPDPIPVTPECLSLPLGSSSKGQASEGQRDPAIYGNSWSTRPWSLGLAGVPGTFWWLREEPEDIKSSSCLSPHPSEIPDRKVKR